MKKYLSALLTGIFILIASFNASGSVKLTENQLNHFQQISFVGHDQAKLTLYNQGDANNQKLVVYTGSYNDFLFIPAETVGGDYYYYIAEKSTGKLVTIKDVSSANNYAMVIYQFTGGDNQKFKLIGNANTGKYKIVAKSSNKALAVSNQNFAQNNDIVQYDVAGANDVILIQSQEIPARPAKMTETPAEEAPRLTGHVEPIADAPWHVVGQTYIPYFLISQYQTWDTDSYKILHTPYYLLTRSVGYVRSGDFVSNGSNAKEYTSEYVIIAGSQSSSATNMSSRITKTASLSLGYKGISATGSIQSELGLDSSSMNTNYSEQRETIARKEIPPYTSIQVYSGAIKYDLYGNNVTPNGSNALETWVIKKPKSTTTVSYPKP